jgi:SAM-dependent methyltransferase
MIEVELAKRIKNKIRLPLPLFKLWNDSKPKFQCPICKYLGPFADFRSFGGFREHALCPSCGALERHRLQYLVLDELEESDLACKKMLHVAPEKFLREVFSRRFSEYETADLFMKGVDHNVDLMDLPFANGSYDIVFASHVLEHIRDDKKAVAEIRRILKPNGIAILPVPVVCAETIEYPEANPHEAGHVRAPGLDYFERYREHFGKVTIASSETYPQKYQLYIYEDRSQWPTRECPMRRPMQGKKHADYVPICYV